MSEMSENPKSSVFGLKIDGYSSSRFIFILNPAQLAEEESKLLSWSSSYLAPVNGDVGQASLTWNDIHLTTNE